MRSNNTQAAANVVPLPGNPLPGLGIASVASPGEPISGSRNAVWLCQAYTEGTGLLLYVKPGLGLRRMLVELLAAQLAQCMHLPCPNPYLVTVPSHYVGLPQGTGRLIAFGSEAAGARSLARPVTDLHTLWELLDSFKLTEALWVFDEWIANDVRSPRDVLLDPVVGLQIIDHEGAMAESTQPDAQLTHWLADRVLERTPERQRPALVKALRARAAAAHRAALGEVPTQLQFVQGSHEVYTQLVGFLALRLHHLERLISARVYPNQGSLL